MIQAQIVIPCFNEADGLDNLIDECLEVIQLSKGALGFILVNNGSKDSSKLIFEELHDKYPNITIVELPENQGYGGGILAGLNKSSASIIGWTHADLQTPLVDCLRAVNEIKGEVTFVKGQRTGRSISDQIFSSGMGIFESLLFQLRLSEINAQPTVFSRNFLEKWSNPPCDFSLDLYALVMAVRGDLQIRRIMVDFLPREFGHSKWNMGIKSRIRFIKRTMRYSFYLRKVLNANL
jgi:glycosyltransferase involved in cell wall biosynthesis